MGVAQRLRRHGVAVVVVAAAVCAVGAVFAFARPAYRPPKTVIVHMAGERHFSVAQIRRVFAAHRISLVQRSTLRGTIFFGRRSPGDDGFTLTLYAPQSTVGLGGSDDSGVYERRIGNVDVFYGGRDRGFAERVAAAVEALRRLPA